MSKKMFIPLPTVAPFDCWAQYIIPHCYASYKDHVYQFVPVIQPVISPYEMARSKSGPAVFTALYSTGVWRCDLWVMESHYQSIKSQSAAVSREISSAMLKYGLWSMQR